MVLWILVKKPVCVVVDCKVQLCNTVELRGLGLRNNLHRPTQLTVQQLQLGSLYVTLPRST